MAVDKKSAVRNAQKQVQKGQLDRAIATYKAILKMDPNDEKVHNALGDLFIRRSQKKEGIAEYLWVANYYEKDGFHLRSIAICQKILNLDADMVEVRLKLADLYTQQHLPAEAKKQYLTVADYYDRKGKVAEALEVFGKIADLDPGNLGVRAKLGMMYEKQDLPSRAAGEYLQAAKGYVKNKEFEEAEKLLARAVKLEPSNPEVRLAQVDIQAGREQWPDVVESLAPLVAEEGVGTQTLKTYAAACLKVEKTAEAIGALEKALKLKESSLALKNLLGRAYLEGKEFGKAYELFEPTIKGYLADGKTEAAEDLARQLAEADPGSEKAQRQLHGVLVAKGESEEAAAVMALIEQMAPPAAVTEAPPPPPPAAPPAADEEMDVELLDLAGEDLTDLSSVDLAEEAGPEAEELEISFDDEELAFEEEDGGETLADEPAAEAPAAEEVPMAEAAADAIDLSAEVLEEPPEAGLSEDEELEITFDDEELAIDDGLIEGPPPEAPADAIDLSAEPLDESLGADVPTEGEMEISLGDGDLAVEEGAAAEPLAEAPALAETIEEEAPAPEEADAIDLALETPEAVTEEAAPQEETAAEAVESMDLGAELPPAEAEAPPEWKAEDPAAAAGQDYEDLDIDLEALGDEGPSKPAIISESPRGAARAETSEEMEEFLAEADFYMQQGLFDEAEFLYRKLQKLDPGDESIAGRLARLEEEKAGSAAAPAPPAKGSGEESILDQDMISALESDLDRVLVDQSPPTGDGTKLTVSDESGDAAAGEFTDFLSELRDELEEPGVPEPKPVAESEESLSSIFQEFQEGLKEQLGEEDFETHYNLGIAYKEMGLMEEAIGEFVLSEKSTVRQIDSISMMALCLREMGREADAAAKLDEGLALSEEGTDKRKGFLYDLADLYEGMGRTEESMDLFARLAGTDPGYRDVAERLKKLSGGKGRASPSKGSGTSGDQSSKVSYL